jgi:alpha-ribazole phosphatase/probable phosphoglycerate mutase
VVRHGQVDGHDQLIFNGHSDVELTELGRAQARAAAQDLADSGITAVYASDLKRARFGGEAVAAACGVDLHIEPDFREIFFGDWEGMTFEDIEARFPGALAERRAKLVDYRPPQAETVGEFGLRVDRGLSKVLEAHMGERVALVAHSGVNRALILLALGVGLDLIWRVHQDYACINIIEYFPDGFTLVRRINQPNRVSEGASSLVAYSAFQADEPPARTD